MQKCNHKYYYHNPIAPFHITNYTIIRENGYLLPTWVWKKNLPTFQLNDPVVIRPKVKEVWTNAVIYSHALLRIHVIGSQRSVRIALPSLPPHPLDKWQLEASRRDCLCRWNFPHIPRDFVSFLDWLFCNLWVSYLFSRRNDTNSFLVSKLRVGEMRQPRHHSLNSFLQLWITFGAKSTNIIINTTEETRSSMWSHKF